MKPVRLATLLSLAFAGTIGCSQSEPASESPADDAAMLAEILGPDQDAEPRDAAEPDATAAESSAESSRHRAAPAGERLELRLQKGDRFPLFKTVEQRLVQKSDDHPALASTRLELGLAMTVDEVNSDGVLMSVVYSRVAYEHDVNGQRLNYDSQTHDGVVPHDAVPYAGMVGNGFSFWLGRDNTIRELVGYREFLERCVRDVPLERRQSMLAEISSRFGDDGVANFIDDSIGLLPFDASVDPDSATRVMPGDVWTRERRLMQPVPIYLTSTYRLTDLSRETAEIDITGRIATGEAVNGSDNARLRITGGHSMGRCLVDRASGLPLQVDLTRNIRMVVTTADQKEVVQEKEIVTSIRTFPERRGPVAGRESTGTFRTASGVSESADAVQHIPSVATPGNAVRAVYPE